MRKSKSIDPFVSDIIEKNNQKIYPTLGSTANPLRKRASGHLWEFPLQNVNGDSIKVIRIKAEDNYGFSVQNEFTEFFSQ
jgi:hypothetical protein